MKLNKYVDNSRDCNDEDPTINPDATETSDLIDQDCDEDVDEDSIDGSTFSAMTTQMDLVRQMATPWPAANLDDGFVDNSEDCDDGNADVSLRPSKPATRSMTTATMKSTKM